LLDIEYGALHHYRGLRKRKTVITHAFTRHDILDLKVVLFVSEYVHSHGTFTAVVIETPGDPNTRIFNNVYNNIFA